MKCDKKGREGSDDPCSECRHFGGENTQYLLDNNKSWNNAVWEAMMNRRFTNDYNVAYTLAAYDPSKNRSDTNKFGYTRKPMPNIKPDWQGQTKEQLRGSGDLLNPEIRKLPRAFVVPPKEKNNKERHHKPELKGKRPAPGISSDHTPAAPMPDRLPRLEEPKLPTGCVEAS